MDNQEETNNYNLMKAVGLGVLMVIMLLAFFTQKDDASIFGIPSETLHKTDSTSTK